MKTASIIFFSVVNGFQAPPGLALLQYTAMQRKGTTLEFKYSAAFTTVMSLISIYFEPHLQTCTVEG